MSGEPGQVQGQAMGGLDPSFDEAMSRLDLVLRKVSGGAAALSFDTGLDTGMPAPERELLASLAPVAGAASPSFSTGAASAADENAAVRMLHELLDRARTRARVSSEVDGRVVAATWIGRAGDITSSVAATFDSEQFADHLAALRRTLRQRHERTRLLLSALEVAGKIALATGTGNPLLALPAAVRFLRGIMSEQEALDS